MPADIIDGKQIAQSIRDELKAKTTKLIADTGIKPCLAVLLVGNMSYVKMKTKAALECGFALLDVHLDDTATENKIIAAVKDLNSKPEVHGILVQLPLPRGISEKRVLAEVSIEKDVDGFHPFNIGSLAMKGHTPLFTPCTPTGVMVLLERSNVDLKGKRVVVLGRSNIVGMPMALMMIQANATVTVCHSQTVDLKERVKEADVIIAAVGQPEMVKKDWVKPGAVVIDVGSHSVPDASKPKGCRTCGDVETVGVMEVASKLAPSPGGVGPMTVAILMSNTFIAAQHYVDKMQKSCC